jgi:hypothetical protein
MTKNNDNENINIIQAKKSIKSIIKLMETLRFNINGSDPQMKMRSLLATWFIHRYINDDLMSEVENEIILVVNAEQKITSVTNH